MESERVFAKCAWRLLPLIIAAYVFNYIDRVNVGFAALTMNRDLGFSASVYGFGVGILFDAGYSVPVQTSTLWHPSYAVVRKTERFQAYARSAGLVDYWRAKGWPDLCRPIGADDFVCD